MSRPRSAKVSKISLHECWERGFALKKESWATIGLGLLLVSLTLAAYWPVLRAGFIWDDDAHLTANPCIVGPLGFKAIWTTSSALYYPLVLTTFWVEHALWGMNPLFFHLVNVLTHALSAILLWRALSRLDVWGAWFGAALWALHPIQVESVAWITELKNTQSCFFYLLAVLFFLRWRRAFRDEVKATLDYGLVVLFAVLAILSKSSTVMLPIVLALCWWWKDRRWRWRNTIWLLPILMVSAAASAWTVWEQKFHSGAQGEEWGQSALERLAIAGKAVWFYVGKLLWPHPLIFVYPRWQVDVLHPIFFFPAAAAVFLCVILWFGRDHEWLRPVFFGFAYFLVSLFPVLGFFDVYFFRYSFVGDHFQYLASMGLIALVGAALTRLPKPARMLSVVLLLVLLVMTWQQTKIYRDQEMLWRDTLAKNPAAWIAHTILANALAQQGRLAEAIQHYEQTLEIKPDYAEAHNNLGLALAEEGKLAQAIQHYERALQLKPTNGEACNNLGVALAAEGNLPEAIRYYERALQLKKDYAEAHYNLGIALTAQGKLPEAIKQYERALQLKPNYPQAYYSIGNALAHQGNLPEAIRHYARALQLKPDYAEAYVNLGGALALQGKLQEAIHHYERALQLKPDNVEVHCNLGGALAQQGNLPEAIHHYERALQLKPDDPEIDYNLASVLARQGKMPEAIQHFEQALALATVQNNSALAEAIRAWLNSYRQTLPRP